MKLILNKIKNFSKVKERKLKSEMSSSETCVIHLDSVTHFYSNDNFPTIENLNLLRSSSLVSR